MKLSLRALLIIVATAGFAQVASAQYLFLDTNGNLVHDTGDRLNANGTPTTVDLYVRTNQNRDGSLAMCDTGPEALTINQYQFNLLAVGGTVTYSGFANRQALMPFSVGELNPDGVRYKNGYAGGTQLAPGTRRLCSLIITGVSGFPRIDIVDLVSGSLDFTGFGTSCLGRAFDNIYRLDGPNVLPVTGDFGDFTDWDGLAATPGGPSNPPVVTNPGNKTTDEEEELFFFVTASDPDGQPLMFSLALGTPPADGATITSEGYFTWTPTEAQGPGVYPVTITATDNGAPELSGSTGTTITVNEVNVNPIVANPGFMTTSEQANLTFTATATDSDLPAQTLTWSLWSSNPQPTGATIDPSTGAFSWTPAEAQGPGDYPVSIAATDDGGRAGYAPFTITVTEVNQAPVLAPIGNKTGQIGVPITFTATATDADIPANTLTFSLDAGAPPGATIGATTGAFSWTPTTSATVPVTIRVTDNGAPALSDFETITIATFLGDPYPVLDPIGNKTVNELTQLAFTVTATDPDPGATLTFSWDPGAPAGASIASTGAFTWTPTEAQGPGNYPITFRVTNDSNPPLSDFETIIVTVREVNAQPVLAAIGNRVIGEGSLLAFTATATDADIPANTLCFSLDTGSPPGATIGCGTGILTWTPSPGQAGTYLITVRATDNGLPPLSDSETITVLVFHVGAQPHANAGGPYSGIVNSPVSFDGTGSSDPDGDALTYAWDFGDGHTCLGATPMHVYPAPGIYNIILRVTDPDGNYDEDVTTVTIRSEISVVLALKNGKSTINLGDRDVLKVGIEELELPYTAVLVGTVRLSTDFPNAGTVAECAADPKHTRIGDLDRNGVPDLEVRFPIACIRNLFRNTPNNTSVNLILTGEFETSTGTIPFRGVMVVTIKTGGAGAAPVLAYPNPFNPEGRISFVTGRPGNASIQLFDLQGRLVRTLLPQQYLGAGAHEVAIDGRNDQGVRLSSGVYFYRVMTADGVAEGSVSVLK